MNSRLRKVYGMATLFAKAGVRTPRPNDSLFVSESVYEWRLLDELAVASHWVRDFASTKSACEELLERIEQGLEVPEADVRRIRENLEAAVEKLEKAKESTG